jgi:uncharacterized membrane protein YqjE
MVNNVLMHNILIAIHAFGGILAFITGAIVLLPSVHLQANRRWIFNLFLVSIAILLIPLYLVISIDWPQLGFIQQAAFLGLGVLGLYMAWRSFQARKSLQEQFEGWQPKYMDHIGFNLISLFEGFIIVAVIDLGAPDWLVGVIAILGLVGGIWSVNKVKSRMLQSK